MHSKLLDSEDPYVDEWQHRNLQESLYKFNEKAKFSNCHLGSYLPMNDPISQNFDGYQDVPLSYRVGPETNKDARKYRVHPGNETTPHFRFDRTTL